MILPQVTHLDQGGIKFVAVETAQVVGVLTAIRPGTSGAIVIALMRSAMSHGEFGLAKGRLDSKSGLGCLLRDFLAHQVGRSSH